MAETGRTPPRLSVVEDTCTAASGASPTRLALIAVCANPCAGRNSADMPELVALGHPAGEYLTREGVRRLGAFRVESHGKAAIVGLDGELEHAAAILHVGFVPGLRSVLPSGSLMPATKRVAGPGAEITVPQGHIHDAWSLAHWDAIHVALPAYRVGDYRSDHARLNGDPSGNLPQGACSARTIPGLVTVIRPFSSARTAAPRPRRTRAPAGSPARSTTASRPARPSRWHSVRRTRRRSRLPAARPRAKMPSRS